MKVIDCFSYNGESLALFRLAYLWDVVDEFVMVEARETHSGQKKDGLFLDKNAALLEPFASKITRLVIDAFPTPTDAQLAQLINPRRKTDLHAWFKEKYQRNFPGEYLNSRESQPPWVLLTCDADEIPRRKLVTWLARNYDACTDGFRLQMSMFYYSSHWVKPGGWNHPFAINDLGVRHHKLDALRVTPIIRKIIDSAGWHLSYFMTRAEIQRKVQSFANTELSGVYRDLEWIEHCIRTGEDLHRRGPEENCERYSGDDLPEGLVAFERLHGIGTHAPLK